MGDDTVFGRWYRRNLGEPLEPDDVSGYWTFLLGAFAALVALCFLLLSTTYGVESDPYFLHRQIAFTLAMLAGPVVGLSVVYLLPLRERAVTLALAGLVVCAGAIAAFNLVYPGNWNHGLDYTAPILSLYAGGVSLQLLAIFLYPLLSDDTAQPSAAPVADDDASQATFQLYEDRDGEHRWRLRHDDGEIVANSGEGFRSRQNARQGVESVRKNAPGADEEVLDAPPSAAEGSDDEGSTDDGPGETGLAEAGFSTATPTEATTEATDTAADATGSAADDTESAEDAADATDSTTNEADDGDDPIPDSGRFELYRDAEEQWRWRLRVRNGNVVADSGQGHSARSAIEEAIERVRSVAPEADALEYDPAGFERYKDESGGWRWRLRHRNGQILADSGEGYTSRGNAQTGIERVRDRATDVNHFEVYEDAGGEFRWRLTAENGDVVADSGEGYSSERSAREAVERVSSYAPVADSLAYEPAGFEIYQDSAGEWRWRLRHRNGAVLADSGESYTVKAKARQGMRSVMNNAAGAAVVGRER